MILIFFQQYIREMDASPGSTIVTFLVVGFKEDEEMLEANVIKQMPEDAFIKLEKMFKEGKVVLVRCFLKNTC